MINGKKLVALCTSRVYEPQIHSYIVKLNKRLIEKGYSLLIFAINSDIYWEEDRIATEKYIFELIPYEYLDCIIIMDEKIKSHKIAHKIINQSESYNIPVVVADGKYDNVSCINFDYEKGFEQVVRHVIEHHKVTRPHMMAGQPDNEFSNRRIDIFKKVLSENNIEFDQNMLSYGYFWADPCRIAMQKILDQEELPEAMICANDVMAITVSDMLSDAGYKVPDDIIVTGFDGYDEIYFTSPKVTSASCDIILLADATADAVINAIENGIIRNHTITPSFIANESCGCPEYSEQGQALRDLFNESFARHNDDNRILQQITSSMQTSNTVGEMVSNLDCYKTDSILLFVDRNCFMNDDNYFTLEETTYNYSDNSTNKQDKHMTKDFALIYDSDHVDKYKPDTFIFPETDEEHSENVLSKPFRDRVLELTDSGYPLIFNALDFMNRPFGFICFYYRNYFISNYSNSMNVTNAISIGFGGYINMRYQRSLLNKMDEMYRHDSLTGLYNRIGFQNVFKKLCKNPEYNNHTITVIMSDLDGLKYINDTFGHAEGDNAISTVARALDNATPDSALCVRFGGDELFAVIFGECYTDKITDTITEYLKDYNETSGKPYIVSTSCGSMTTILDDNFSITQALKEADDKMYIIKKNRMGKRG